MLSNAAIWICDSLEALIGEAVDELPPANKCGGVVCFHGGCSIGYTHSLQISVPFATSSTISIAAAASQVVLQIAADFSFE